MIIFTIIGIITVSVFLWNIVVDAINNRRIISPRTKLADWERDYNHIDKEYFLENYHLCDYCKSYQNLEEGQCICYAR